MANLASCYVHSPAGYLSHVSLNLIKGLAAEGVQVYCNLRDTDMTGSPSATYQETAPFFSYAEFAAEASFCILDVTHGLGDVGRLNEYIRGRMVAIVNMSDGANFSNVHYSKSFLTFAAHCNKLARHGGKIYPLGVGVSREVSEKALEFDLERKALKVVNNFNPTFRQSVRDSLSLCMVEKLSQYLPIDARRVPQDEYWPQLAESAAVLAYCGEFYSDLRRFAYMRDNVIKGQPDYDFAVFERESVVFRWDSYRFWEAAVFACAPVQLNFEKYGMELPVMPVPWVHYVPIDLAEVSSLPDKIAALLREDPRALHKIGRNARQWALEHYSPEAVARYVLGIMKAEWA